jgi:DNA-binding SARP family transcriptional activator
MTKERGGRATFRILGPLVVMHDEQDITPTAPKIRQVLTLLLVRRNQLVQVAELIDELWGDNPPGSSMTTLQTYIYKLRKDLIDRNGLGRLITKPSGYLLDVGEELIDACAFEALTAQGRAALEAGDSTHASELLSEGLSLWRGQAFVGVATGEALFAYATHLEEQRLRALEMRIEADLELGYHQRLVSELKMLTFTHPLHERFHADLMTALHRSGRRYEALEVFRRLRGVLIDELGLEPSGEVQRLHKSLLSADVDLDEEPETAPQFSRPTPVGPPAAIVTPPRAPTPGPAFNPVFAVPCQLPSDIADFTGRVAAVEQACRTLRPRGEGMVPRLLAICGMPGIGKTTLAVRSAHLNRSAYPDGQLYADLRGSTGQPAHPTDVLGSFLRAAGLSGDQIPEAREMDERAKLFRTWTADRRLLLLLDDAASAAQIVPLLPANPRCAVVVTSRQAPQGLPGVTVLTVEGMDRATGNTFLGRLIGEARVAAQLPDAERIVELCGGVPLALRSLGARLAASPSWPLVKLVRLIEACATPLDVFEYAEFDLRNRYDEAFAKLEAGSQRTLRLLGLLPPREFSVEAVADVLGSPHGVMEAELNLLHDWHLLELCDSPRADEPRYAVPPITRLYARDRVDREFCLQ